jgi:hypothetical protein
MITDRDVAQVDQAITKMIDSGFWDRAGAVATLRHLANAHDGRDLNSALDRLTDASVRA